MHEVNFTNVITELSYNGVCDKICQQNTIVGRMVCQKVKQLLTGEKGKGQGVIKEKLMSTI